MALIDGLQRYYPLDGNADDVHGGIDAVITGPSPAWDTGHIGAQGLDLSASASNKCRADPFIATDFSASFWFRHKSGAAAPFGTFIGNMQSGGVTADWLIFGSAGPSSLRYYGPGNAAQGSDQGSFSVAGVYHVVITRTGTTARIYIDGALAGSPFTVTTGGTNDDFLLASRNDAYTASNIVLEQVGLWDRVLSDAEVTELYNSGAGLAYDDLGTPTPTPAPPKLELNGINLGALMAASSEPQVMQRDAGDISTAVDGTERVTRNARKLDTTFQTVPLSVADAYAWRCLLTGEGETWSFDAHLYGSKGTAASAITNATYSAGSAKFGAGKLSVGASTGTISFVAAINSWGSTSNWSVGVWRYESGAWHHYLVRSDGAKWVDGVRNDAASTTWLTVLNGSVTIANSTGSAVPYDDLVVLPFLVLEDWAAQWFEAAFAFGQLPFHVLTGALVNEQASRVVHGLVEQSSVVKVADGVRLKFEVELRAR